MSKSENSLEKYTIQFPSVFLDNEILEAFKKHLDIENNPEPLMFLKEIELLKKVTDKKENVKKFKEIYEFYIKEEGKYEINISGKIKKNIRIKYEEIKDQEWSFKETPCEILEEARASIYCVLYLDCFPRFIRSKIASKIYEKHLGDTKYMLPLLSLKKSYLNQDFDNPMITDTDIYFLKAIITDSFNWKLIYSESNKIDPMNVYVSKVNYLPNASYFKNNFILKWDIILPYNYQNLFYQNVREELDNHITHIECKNYLNQEEYGIKLNDKENKKTLGTFEIDISLPFPYQHLRKYFFTATADYDEVNETIYFFQKPYVEEKYRKLDFSKDKIQYQGYTSKKQEKPLEKQCYMYMSYEVFVFQKINDHQTRYQQFQITVINEWNISLFLNNIGIQRGKEIRKFCHLGQKNPIKKEFLKDSKGRGKVAYDLVMKE